MFSVERIAHVFTIDNPVPATGTPMGLRRPMVHFVRFCFKLAGIHGGILRTVAMPHQIRVQNRSGNYDGKNCERTIERSQMNYRGSPSSDNQM
jgi:hypothetical protein